MNGYLSELASKIVGVDFVADFVNVALGAFLGFVFAMLVEKRASRKKRMESIENIKDELRDILRSLSETNQDSQIVLKDDRTFPSRFAYSISTPVWDAVQGNGDLLQFRGKDYYEQLITVYNLITSWRGFEDWAFENYRSWSDREREEGGEILVGIRNRIYSILTSRDGNSEPVSRLLSGVR